MLPPTSSRLGPRMTKSHLPRTDAERTDPEHTTGPDARAVSV